MSSIQTVLTGNTFFLFRFTSETNTFLSISSLNKPFFLCLFLSPALAGVLNNNRLFLTFSMYLSWENTWNWKKRLIFDQDFLQEMELSQTLKFWLLIFHPLRCVCICRSALICSDATDGAFLSFLSWITILLLALKTAQNTLDFNLQSSWKSISLKVLKTRF